MQLVYAQRTNDPALVYVVETSETLLPDSWSIDPSIAIATSVTGLVFDQVTVSAVASEGKKFLRLRIETP